MKENEVIKNEINQIVDDLQRIEDARINITETVNNISKTYDIRKPSIRAAANIIFKRNKEEIQEKNEEVLNLVSLCL